MERNVGEVEMEASSINRLALERWFVYCGNRQLWLDKEGQTSSRFQ